MSTQFIEILDRALERLHQKDSISRILEDYADQAEYLTPLLNAADLLNSVPPVEMPSDEAMQMDRAEFLARIESTGIPAVSPGLFIRLQGWISSIIPRASLQKEKQNMSTILARTTLVVALLFGATGGAYAMADSSLPNEPMYGAKLALEQVQLNMVSDPAGIATRHLFMAQNRFYEIVQMAQNGISPDAGTMTRLETHINTAFQFAAQVQNEGELLGLLTRAHQMVQAQLRTMSQLQLNGEDPAQQQLRLTMGVLLQFQNQVEAGMQNTNAFRLQYQSQNQNQNQNQIQNQQQNQNQNQQQNQNQNQQQTGEGATSSQTGDFDCPNCPCVDCDGDQSRDQDRDQIQDQIRDQSCDETQPEQPLQGDCLNCLCDGCDADGSQNQNGAKPK